MKTLLKLTAIILLTVYFTACASAKEVESSCAVDLRATLFLSNHEEFTCLNTYNVKPRFKVIAIMGGDSYLENDTEFRTRLENLVEYAKARADYVIYFSELEGHGTSSQASIAVEVMIDKKIQVYDTFSVGFARVKPVETYITEILVDYLDN